jgi:hypothetical protein
MYKIERMYIDRFNLLSFFLYCAFVRVITSCRMIT